MCARRLAHVEPPPSGLRALAYAVRGRYPLGAVLTMQAFMLVQRLKAGGGSQYNATASGVAVEARNANALALAQSSGSEGSIERAEHTLHTHWSSPCRPVSS